MWFCFFNVFQVLKFIFMLILFLSLNALEHRSAIDIVFLEVTFCSLSVTDFQIQRPFLPSTDGGRASAGLGLDWATLISSSSSGSSAQVAEPRRSLSLQPVCTLPWCPDCGRWAEPSAEHRPDNCHRPRSGTFG